MYTGSHYITKREHVYFFPKKIMHHRSYEVYCKITAVSEIMEFDKISKLETRFNKKRCSVK